MNPKINKNKLKIISALFLILFVPHIFFVLLNFSSLAVGILFSSMALIFFNSMKISMITLNKKAGTISLFLLLFLFVSSIHTFIFLKNNKPILSFVLFLIVFQSILLFQVFLRRVKIEQFLLALQFVMYVIIFFAWLELVVEFQPLSYGNREKPLFPFSEYSHFALTLGPIAIVDTYYSKQLLKKIINLINIILLSVILPSLTLLVFLIPIAFVIYVTTDVARLYKKLVIITLVIPIIIIFLSLILQSSYFSSRLSISENSTNLSALIWLQGYKEIENVVANNKFLGQGFQMMGTGEKSDVMERVNSLAGGYLNLEDAGFLSAKIIGELGYFGILIFIYFMVAFFKAVISIWRSGNNNEQVSYKKILQLLTIGFSVEFLFRGYGYFSPVLFLLVTILLLEMDEQRLRRLNNV